ncbi:MAG: 3-dehydroquinate synthase family protein, partial [Acidimicrobiales bacterium]
MITVPVEAESRSYEVLVGAGARHCLGDMVPAAARRVAVVTQEGVGVEVDPRRESGRFVIDQGEAAKSLGTVERLCREFARWGLTRADIVVGVGGGVVTDVAGFAAATYHRGIGLINVATTLLAQVDAAIGGKTGVNIPEGKNLIGAFWQPIGVLCDTEVLSTLPPREYASGLGEMAKYSFLGEKGLESLPLDVRVARCVELKARVVRADERESGARAMLNYGHTLAHALEALDQSRGGELDLRHGEAVAIGLVFAARLARRLGRVGDGVVDDHARVVSGYGLPTEVPPGVGVGDLVPVMYRDKKAVSGLTMV